MLLYYNATTSLPRLSSLVVRHSQSITTRHFTTRHAEPKLVSQPQLPRYLRRQKLASSSTESENASKMTPRSVSLVRPQFRSRYYDPTRKTDSDAGEMRMLEPHILSSRLRKLCDAGKVDEAVAMLKNAPLDAQNTPVWNTLIWECMKAKRFQLGYQLFIDMKRRGFSPTTRTFHTMFNGLLRIEQWQFHTKQLANARSLYDALQRHMTSVKKHDPSSEELSVDPLATYIRILGDAGAYQDIFDVYYAMDSEGPLAPNQYIFTAMFQALSSNSTSENSMKTAGDARLLWAQMLKASKKPAGFIVDSHIATSAITALSRGSETDQDLAFQIAREYFGLGAFETGSSPTTKSTLHPQSLDAILKLCNASRKHDLCTELFQQIRQRPEVASILDRAHVEEVLRAWLSLPPAGAACRALELLEWMLRQEIIGKNGHAIRPASSTYNLVIAACWRSVDWTSATRTFDLMTGYHTRDFVDGIDTEKPKFTKRGNGRNLIPTAEFMSSMVRTAFASKNPANMRQCLRIVNHLSIDSLLISNPNPSGNSRKATKNRAFYCSKLASALIDTVEYLQSRILRSRPSQIEEQQWSNLVSQALKYLRSEQK